MWLARPDSERAGRGCAGGPAPLEALRNLQDAGVAVTEFQLRRPTLDDVFLALTEEQAA